MPSDPKPHMLGARLALIVGALVAVQGLLLIATLYHAADLRWLASAAGIAAAAAAAAYLVGRALTRRLESLSSALSALAAGQPPRHVRVRGTAEVRQLAQAIAGAARATQSRYDDLSAREARFRAIAEYAYGVEMWFNPRGRLVWINRSIERFTGYTPLECVLAGNPIEMLVYQKDRRYVEEQAARAFKGAPGDNLELRLARKDGQLVWVSANWQAVRDRQGRDLGLRVSLNDIQARKEAEARLLETVAELRRTQGLKDFYLTRAHEERARMGALLDVMQIGVLFVDRGRVLYGNKALYQIWGVPEPASLTGVRQDMLLARTASLRADDAAYRHHFAAVVERTETSGPHEFLLTDGRTLRELSAMVPGERPGDYIGRVWLFEDITEQKHIADRLTQLAERDPLTGLFNRRRFYEESGRMLADAARRGDRMGMIMIDLDNFKPINDCHGHQAGDRVLTDLAAEVGGVVRRNEMFFRVGGDEFAILAPDSSEGEMISLARRILATVAAMCFRFEDEECRITASIGIAMYPAHGCAVTELAARADQAMYRAKGEGGNRWKVFSESGFE
jgi:diguanylate cyclase (GGDEF)-like protein/PAS domain S-box-containing protein